MPVPRIRHALARRRRSLLAVVGAVAVVGGGLGTIQAATATPSPNPWLDARAPLSTRVDALLRSMTLEEKVGQMDHQLVTTLTAQNGTTSRDRASNLPHPDCMKKILIDSRTGSVLAGGTNNPVDTTGKGGVGNTGYDWATEYNLIQQYAVKNSRLHIPLIFGVEMAPA